MKTIFIKSTPYLFAFFVINIIFYLTSWFYKQEKKYTNQIDYALESKPKIILLGDSHVKRITLLDLSDNTRNLAFGADGIEEMYIKLLIMLKYNPKLECIFISTEPQIFNNSISANSTFLNKYILSLNDSLNVYNKSKLNLISEMIPTLNDKFLDYFLNKCYINIRSNKINIEEDWINLTKFQRKKIAVKAGKSDHNGIMSEEYKLDIYQKIISLCKMNNIKIVGVRFPVTPHYIGQLNEKDLINVNSYVRGLNLDFHLDYLSELKNPEYFDDADHLNEKGMEKIANMIFRDTNIKLTK